MLSLLTDLKQWGENKQKHTLTALEPRGRVPGATKTAGEGNTGPGETSGQKRQDTDGETVTHPGVVALRCCPTPSASQGLGTAV